MNKQSTPPVSLEALEQISVKQAGYKKNLKELQLQLLRLQRSLSKEKRSLIVVMEGPDAAGKGGAIKRIVEKLDPRHVRVYSTIKPTSEEYKFNYLRRFWLRLPPYGAISVFDRSWYGRVLVERVEGFATQEEWERAYEEINFFEKQLADDGALFVKLYIQITKKEQLARFKSRQADPYKHWKISEEDWRNRRKWKQHIAAAEDMFAKTSKPHAQWTIIPGNFKWHARVESLRCVVSTLEGAGIKP